MDSTHKIVDIDVFLPTLIELTEAGRSVSLTITGNSMSPFLIHGRDQISFQKPIKVLKRGDMVFFRRRTGGYVMHRICRIDDAGNYYLVGDGQQYVEGPIAPEQIFGIVTQVCRKGRWLGPKNFWWRFFAGPWLWLRPVRPVIRRCYSIICRIRRKGGGFHDTKAE